MTPWRRVALVALVIGGQAQPAHGQERLVIPRLTTTVVVDGRVDEPAWADLPPLPAVQSSPTFGAPPSERTELRLAYDDRYLYASGRFYDRDPTGLRATSLKRDETSMSNDWLVLSLDTFRDRETTVLFATNPAGVRTDGVFSGDGATWSATWNTVWDAAVVRLPDGWSAEIRIPLSSLRFESAGDEVVMGATIWRWVARKSEVISWPAVPHNWGSNSIYKASQMADIAMHGLRRRSPAYVTPYGLTGGARAATLNPAGDAFTLPTDVQGEAGMDIKFTPSDNLTVDLTVNTDFAQVEADDQQVNLTRFSLFFAERRLFFQERASVFEYPLGGNEQLFYSRRIGLVDGTPVRIYGGARMVGRVAGWDVASLSMLADAPAASATENASVVRLRRRTFNPNSYLGAIVTSRVGAGTHNVAVGVDALVRLFGQDYLSVNLAHTWDAADTVALDGDQRLARARWERRGQYGLSYQAEAATVGDRFLPALGFLARRDHLRASARVAWGFRGPAGSPVLRQTVSLATNGYHHRTRDLAETAEVGAEWALETRRGRIVALGVSGRYDDLAQPFSLGSGVSVPAGLHRFVDVSARHDPSSGSPFRISAAASAGGFYDGRRLSASVTPTWNTSRHLQLSGTYQLNRLSFDTRQQALTTHLARARAQVMFTSQTVATGFLQYNSALNGVVVNLRFRYNPAEGHDLYLVYNHGLNTDRPDVAPERPLTEHQALLVKYSRTVTLGR